MIYSFKKDTNKLVKAIKFSLDNNIADCLNPEFDLSKFTVLRIVRPRTQESTVQWQLMLNSKEGKVLCNYGDYIVEDTQGDLMVFSEQSFHCIFQKINHI